MSEFAKALKETREEKEALERELLERLRSRLPELEALFEEIGSHWHGEDGFYRFYHGSFKVARLRDDTKAIVTALRELLPGRELNERFLQIIEEGAGNRKPRRFCETGRRIVEAFFHARTMLQFAIQYGRELKEPPSMLPSGWAAVLYLYNLR
jgi:hypothetical protein